MLSGPCGDGLGLIGPFWILWIVWDNCTERWGRELRDRDWSRGGSHGPGMGAWDGGCVWGTGAEG